MYHYKLLPLLHREKVQWSLMELSEGGKGCPEKWHSGWYLPCDQVKGCGAGVEERSFRGKETACPTGWKPPGQWGWPWESGWSSVQFTQSCPTLCNPMNRSMPCLPGHHQLLEFTQTHVHRVDDAIQPSHPLSSPSPPALNPSQYQGLFQWVSSSHQVAKVLEFQLQHQSFQQTPGTDLLYRGLVGSPCSSRDSQESFPTPQFKNINTSTLSFLYSPALTFIHDYWKNHGLDYTDLCWRSNISPF